MYKIVNADMNESLYYLLTLECYKTFFLAICSLVSSKLEPQLLI